MTATGQPSKLCVKCGTDCAGRPRVKDPHGRYFCKPCYEAGLLEKQQGKDAARAPAAHAACTSCGHAITQDAVLCTNCGLNVATGRRVAAPVVTESSGVSGTRAAWPLVIGIISILLGLAGTLGHGLYLLLVMIEDRRLGPIAVSVMVLLLALWLFTAGIGIVRRNPGAARSIRRWAMVKIAIYGLSTAVLIVALFTMRNVAATFARSLGPNTNYMGPGAFAAGLLVVLSWFLLWPIVVLIWFSRRGVQDEVRSWT